LCDFLQKLVKIWLDVLKSEESAIDSIAENVSKMLELVSGHPLRIIFLKILVNKVRYSFSADAPVTVFMIYIMCSSIIVENLGKVPISLFLLFLLD